MWLLSRLKDNKGYAEGAMSRLRDRKDNLKRNNGKAVKNKKRHLLGLEGF